MRYKVVGPPGTGKTRRLLNEVHNYVKKGVPLNRIGYFAFTRKAAKEARNRYLDVEKHLTKKDLPYFQTIHSLAFNTLGLKEENVMQELNYKKNRRRMWYSNFLRFLRNKSLERYFFF